MGVLLQAFYQRDNRGVPCPLDGDQGAGEALELGAQLADIRTELVKLNKAVKKPKK